MTKGNTTWAFTYNSDGLRTQRTDGTTTYNYIYNGSQLTHMTVGNNVLHFSYDASGTPMTLTYNGETYYYTVNLQGDITGIYTEAGTQVVAYAYDAWGKILDISGYYATTLGTLNPLRYRGYVYDQETGLYYLQSRYYNPEVGRFINADALIATGQGLLGYNMYAYCGNSPILRSDENGKSWSAKHAVFGPVPIPIQPIMEIITCPSPNIFFRNMTSPVDKADYHNHAPAAAFGAQRNNGRTHKGIDFYPADAEHYGLYGSDGTARSVYSMCDGIVVDRMDNFYKGTCAVVVQFGWIYVLYGEISTELKVGDSIKRGQKIGIMQLSGGNTLMLHLEVFAGGYGSYSRDNPYRIDPTFAYFLPDRRS